MLSLGSAQRIFLYREVTDMRKSFDTLSGLVRSSMGLDPESGDAFVFLGRGHRRVKILMFDRSGFWLLAKRLASGRFAGDGRWRSAAVGSRVELSAAELHLLLEGISVAQARYHRQYSRKSP